MTSVERRLGAYALVRTMLVAGAVSALVTAPAARGQASQAEMSHFPMPPAGGYHATKTFAFVGDFGYFTAPPMSVYDINAIDAGDYRYVRYRGVAGKKVYLYGAWGPNTPPPPSGDADACQHTHMSYGVWAHWSLTLPWFGPFDTGAERSRTIDGWMLAGGGGMSGARNSAGECVHRTDNPLGEIDERFGWGDDFEFFDLRSVPFITELVVGALSNTHGWGTCIVPPGSFTACREPSYIIGYTLP
jgi:hypothetical protein